MGDVSVGLTALPVNFYDGQGFVVAKASSVTAVAGDDMGKPLGLDARWLSPVLKIVGYYSETFERNVGADSPLKLPRGLNDLWAAGGPMYAGPFR